MRVNRYFFFTMILGLLSLIIIGCSSSSSASSPDRTTEGSKETITLKIISYGPKTAYLYENVLDPWMDKITAATDGKVQFKEYPAEQLGKEGDLVKLTSDGVADISVDSVSYYADEMPLSNMLSNLPNLHETTYQGNMAYYDLVQNNPTIMKTDYLNNGVRLLYARVNPTYEIWSKDKQIRVPEDLKGVKVRVSGKIISQLYQHMGAIPVSVPFSDLYEGVNRGVVDAVSLFGIAMGSAGAQEVVNYGTEPHIGSTIDSVMINEKVWQDLPEDIKEIIIKTSEEIVGPVGKMYDEDTKKFNDEFTKNDKNILELTEEEREKWRKVGEEFTQIWLEKNQSKGLPYKEVLEEYKKLLDKYK